MSLKIIVLAKQVPDTHNVGPDAMTPEGTINRSALPAVFNPDDLNALEQALQLKDKFPGSTISVVTMGLPKSAEVIREALYRGADEGYVVTDRPLGGADTLATSYTLAQAIRKIANANLNANPNLNDNGNLGVDIIIGGRQAIDGDTAQVGPQIAEKLGLTQVTYAEEILSLDEEAKKVVIKRHIDGGVETVEAPLPLVVTVNGSAAPCRPRNAKRVMKYKRATVALERNDANLNLNPNKPYLDITQWGAADIDCDPQQIGKAGSPTNVKKVENIVFKAKESRTMTGSDEDINSLMKELISEKIIG
ncbi:MAG: electron transfer flavoprotein subunit beta/FixA family protein [Prevotella sp.]|nr:electron transfer flavoprotein subunit beta/FixA family protein [Prevotella sp.]